jgi:hypothetical protein
VKVEVESEETILRKGKKDRQSQAVVRETKAGGRKREVKSQLTEKEREKRFVWRNGLDPIYIDVAPAAW